MNITGLLFVIVLLVEWNSHSILAHCKVCVKSMHHGSGSMASSSCVEWSALLENTSKYLTSYTKLCFSSGVYNLGKHLLINNVTNLTITGARSRATTKMVTIHCVHTVNSTAAFLSVSNSTFVRIQNFELKGCGANIQDFTSDKSQFFSGESAAILLYNVSSMSIVHISIQDSYGYGIVGINLIGNSVLRSVEIFHTMHKRNDTQSSMNMTVGGLALRYFDIINSHKVVENILIENMTLINIQEMYQLSRPIDGLSSSAIEIAFHHFISSINITIFNANISNVILNGEPLVYILYNSSAMNNVAIHNSTFIKNVIGNNCIICIKIKAIEDISTKKSMANFELSYSKLNFNTALAVCSVIQQDENAAISLKFKMSSSAFASNNASLTFWNTSFMSNNHLILIENCVFTSNIGFELEYYNVGNLTLIGKNLFFNNSVKDKNNGLLRCDDKTSLTFKGYNEFTYNNANSILTLQQYVFIGEHATLNISYNKALTLQNSALFYFKKGHQHSRSPCLFQFISSQKNLDEEFLHNKTTFSLVFGDNQGYYSIFHGSRLNTCYWQTKNAFKLITPGDVYEKVMHLDVNISNVISRDTTTFCSCEGVKGTDCIRDHFGPIFPGQSIPVNLKQILPANNDKSPPYTAVDRKSFSPFRNDIPFEECRLVQPHESKWIQVISTDCTPLSYNVYSPSDNCTTCFAPINSIGEDNSLYLYHIDFKPCPLGFDMYNGSCECNTHLKSVFPTLTCDIDTQTINRPAKSWVGLSSNKDKILYVKRCVRIFCDRSLKAFQIENFNAQCKSNRIGINCGQCPAKLSATFGSYGCKSCSNYWLFLLTVFMVAGILLVLSLFALNLTVVDGKVYGFIIYANLIAGNSFEVFLSRNNISFILLSLFNLDLGIEMCFFNGMTEYDKTWLQFAFPSYLLFIVVMLAFASRYSSSVEKLTRRRVIPVIATIFLLTYSKLLQTTTKVLFSFTTVYSLPDHQSTVIWTWDSSVPLFGFKFSMLFVVCLILFSFVLLPFNFFMLFPKLSYRFRLITEFIKPYLDAYQAPFKNNCSYCFGIELLMRPLYFAFGNGLILGPYKTPAVDILIWVLFLMYLCIKKPFKTTANTVLYISYGLNAMSIVLLVIYFNYDIKNISYGIIFETLLSIAVAEFAVIILYYCYINYLHRVTKIAKVVETVASVILNCRNRFKRNKDEEIAIQTVNAPLAVNYEQYREELLAIDA